MATHLADVTVGEPATTHAVAGADPPALPAHGVRGLLTCRRRPIEP